MMLHEYLRDRADAHRADLGRELGIVEQHRDRRGVGRRDRGRRPGSPVAPSSTSERSPPTDAATTGVPHAAASSATSPNDSARDGHDADVGGPVEVGQPRVRLRRHEAHVGGDTRARARGRARGPAPRGRRGRSGRPPRAASPPGRRARPGSARPCRRPSAAGCVRRTAARGDRRDPSRSLATTGVVREEHRVVDTRRHDLDPLGTAP